MILGLILGLFIAFGSGCSSSEPVALQANTTREQPTYSVLWFEGFAHLTGDGGAPLAFGIVRPADTASPPDVWKRLGPEHTFRSRRELASILAREGIAAEHITYTKAVYRDGWTTEQAAIPPGPDTIAPDTPPTDGPIGDWKAGIEARYGVLTLPLLPDGRRVIVAPIDRVGMSAPLHWPTDQWTTMIVEYPEGLLPTLQAAGATGISFVYEHRNGQWDQVDEPQAKAAGLEYVRPVGY